MTQQKITRHHEIAETEGPTKEILIKISSDEIIKNGGCPYQIITTKWSIQRDEITDEITIQDSTYTVLSNHPNAIHLMKKIFHELMTVDFFKGIMY